MQPFASTRPRSRICTGQEITGSSRTCADYDYEDYAPAYCVGYSGCAQYGGRFEDAEKSLCANFCRIKGDSRLTWEEAIEPIRAAWARLESDNAATPKGELARLMELVAKGRCAA